MTDYITIPTKSQKKHYTNFIKSPRNCTKFSRCNNYKICPTCSKIHREKRSKKLLGHIDENIINSYSHKYLITFTSKIIDPNYTAIEKNKSLNLFINQLIKMTRNKNFTINKNSEYIINKEVSESEYGLNPHFHMILLSNKYFDLNNKQLQELLALYDIEVHKKAIYKKDSYKNSIINIFNYINKFDSTNSKYNILNKEHSNRHSKLFKKKHIKKYKLNILNRIIKVLKATEKENIPNLSKDLYINIIEEYKEKTLTAKKIFLSNKDKKCPKNYLRLLKSLKKKLHKLKIQKFKRIKALKGFGNF